MIPVSLAIIVGGLSVGFYAYMVYPALLWLVGLVRPRPPLPRDPAEWPLISITIPAFNEAHAIGATLDRVLAADYPADRRQVLVVSDHSDDGTDEIVRGYADRGVELIRTPQRGGKTAAENAARDHLRGSIVVNTDASVRIHPEALKPLVRHLEDPRVGVASGRDVSVARMEDDLNLGESSYVGYEMWVRELETRIGSIVGASGCFYAIRRDLHMTLVPEALSRDFAAALIAAEHGYRAVTVNDAVCFVPRIGSLRREYRRKVRTMTRGLETLWFKRHLLNPLRHGLFAWMLWSHKPIRWMAPWGVAVAAVGALLLAGATAWGVPVMAAFAVVAALAYAGWRWPESRRAPRVIALPAYIVSGIIAAIVAWTKAARGELNPVWEPTRRG